MPPGAFREGRQERGCGVSRERRTFCGHRTLGRRTEASVYSVFVLFLLFNGFILLRNFNEQRR